MIRHILLKHHIKLCKSLNNHRQQAVIECLIQLFLTIKSSYYIQFFFLQNWQLHSTWIQTGKQTKTAISTMKCVFYISE